jgi:hypothetical protein
MDDRNKIDDRDTIISKETVINNSKDLSLYLPILLKNTAAVITTGEG